MLFTHTCRGPNLINVLLILLFGRDKRCYFDRLPGNICNIEYWSGFDESRKQNGGGGGFPFRLKWEHPTEIFIPQPGVLYLMHQGSTKKHNTPNAYSRRTTIFPFQQQ